MEKDIIFNYRQPMVTAAGIILGFVLNFATDLTKRDHRNNWIILALLFFTLLGIIFLIIALYRVLNNQYDREKAATYYRRTLHYFVAGVGLSLLSGFLKMIHTLFF